MPRDGSGIYTLPSSNPVVDGTIIDVNWANPTMADIAAQLNNVYTRDGLLGPTGPFKLLDGSVSSPGLTFSSETNMGWYRPSANVTSFAIGGAKVQELEGNIATSTKMTVWPRTSGESGFRAYFAPFGSGDGSNIVMGARTDGGYLASFGNTGANFKPLTQAAASFRFETSPYVVEIDTGGNVTGGNCFFAANNANHGFVGSPTRFDKFGVQVQTYTTDVSFPGWAYSKFLQTWPAGHVSYLQFSSDIYTGALEVKTGVGMFYLRSSHDAEKNGGSASWLIVSSRDKKQDIYDYNDGLPHILAIRPRRFKYIDAPEREQVGIVADEMLSAMPSTILPGMYGGEVFDSGPVLWALVNATKTLHARISQLEAH